MTALTISIVTYHNDQRILCEALDRLSEAVANVIEESVIQEARLVIIDNGNDEAFLLKAVLDHITFEAKVVASFQNIGFGCAHNLVLGNSDSDFHLVLNPDAILQYDALTIGCRHLKEHSGTVMVTPLARQPTGSRAYLCKRYPTVLDLFLRGFAPSWIKKITENRLARYECRDYSDSTVTQGVEIASGCCMLVRSDSLKQVNGFDEDYFLYFEDFDLSLKLARMGSIDYLPRMQIVHHGGNAAKKSFLHVLIFCRSALTFFSKNGWRIR